MDDRTGRSARSRRAAGMEVSRAMAIPPCPIRCTARASPRPRAAAARGVTAVTTPRAARKSSRKAPMPSVTPASRGTPMRAATSVVVVETANCASMVAATATARRSWRRASRVQDGEVGDIGFSRTCRAPRRSGTGIVDAVGGRRAAGAARRVRRSGWSETGTPGRQVGRRTSPATEGRRAHESAREMRGLHMSDALPVAQ